MQAWLTTLLQPARTARDKPDPFRWRDRRSVRAQIASGLRRVAWGAAFIAVLATAFLSLVRISSGPSIVAWTALAACALVMIFTAPRWARFGAFGLLFVLRALIKVLISGAYVREFGEFAGFSVVVGFLTHRFWKTRPAGTTFTDRLALTAFVLCSLGAAAVQQILPALIGLAALAVAWCAARWTDATTRSAAPRASMKEKRL
jgi:hypothetical protein